MNKKLHKKMTNILTSSSHQVEYVHQGNFTIAIVIDTGEGWRRYGVTKRDPNLDEYDEDRGNEIALARAMKAKRR